MGLQLDLALDRVPAAFTRRRAGYASLLDRAADASPPWGEGLADPSELPSNLLPLARPAKNHMISSAQDSVNSAATTMQRDALQRGARASLSGEIPVLRKQLEELAPLADLRSSQKLKEIRRCLVLGDDLAAKGLLSVEAKTQLETSARSALRGVARQLEEVVRSRQLHEGRRAFSDPHSIAPVASPMASADATAPPVRAIRGRRQRSVGDPRRANGRVDRPHQLAHQVGEAIAARQARSRRETAVGLLVVTGLDEEREHLEALEERLSVETRPAQYHAALSARLVLKGLADHCFPARAEVWRDRYKRSHQVADENVGNRLAAFVDQRLPDLPNEEHRLFIATLDTVIRWTGRGPHRIIRQGEGDLFFLRFLEILNVVARAYGAQFYSAA
jgi:hypothetical protein